MLSYKEPVTTYVEKTVTVPSEWGMFSSAGNRSLKKKAEGLVAKIEKADSRSKMASAFLAYFKAWRRMADTKTMSEAGDTAVRESVWCFACNVGMAVGFDSYRLDEIWEESYI
jgi:hypothetical protein